MSDTEEVPPPGAQPAANVNRVGNPAAVVGEGGGHMDVVDDGIGGGGGGCCCEGRERNLINASSSRRRPRPDFHLAGPGNG